MGPRFLPSLSVFLPVLSIFAGCGSSGPPASAQGSGPTNGGAEAGAGGGLFGEGGSSDGSPTSCVTDADCDTHNPCLSYKCTPNSNSGEFNEGQCTYTPVSGCGDAGADAGELPPIDTACMTAPMCNTGLASVYPPYVALVPPSVPASCSNGFELGDANTCGGGAVSYTVQSKTPAGSRAITLDVDFATYLEPDGVLVTGVDSQGNTYTLLDTCRIQTWTSADPTGGVMRPPDQTIRQFRLNLTQGTTKLTFDFGGVVSPMYLQVLGLCDFDLTPFSESKWYQAVP
jgi:hypothetical protein